MPHKPSDKDSKLFASMNFFLKHLALEGIHAAAKCFTSGLSEESTREVFTPQEVDEYNRYSSVQLVYVRQVNVRNVNSQLWSTMVETPKSED